MPRKIAPENVGPQIGLRVTDETHDRLRHIAAHLKLPMGALCRYIVMERLEELPKEPDRAADCLRQVPLFTPKRIPPDRAGF